MSKKFKVVGARVLVDPIITTLSIVERGKLSNIEVIVTQEEIKKKTQGRVVAIGNDPLVHELVKIGDIVHFIWHAGHETHIEDHEYRMIEMQDISMVESLEDDQQLAPVQIPPELPSH